ncbi:MAG: 30S ribosomal protein S20 [Bdellovibrionales bacterium]
MANHKSADKRARQTIKKTAVNTRIKSTVKTLEKKTLAAIAEGKLEDAKALFTAFTSKMDTAAKKGVFHKNKASRKIGRLAVRLTKAS